MSRTVASLALAAPLLWAGCYSFKPSSGAGQTEWSAPRVVQPADVALPAGYRIERVADGFTFPTGVTFNQQGEPVVVEAGYSYGERFEPARLIAIEPQGRHRVIASVPQAGPWTGVVYHNGHYFVAAGDVRQDGKVLRIAPDGTIAVVVDGMPSRGDHHTNGPVIGPDGWLYFAQGTATNSGVVGPDNADFGWLKRFPDFHDVPGGDVVLAGVNFESENPLATQGKTVRTGPYLPFGTPAQPGQVVRGQVKSGGSVLRVRPEGGEPELVAWGLRNPFGLAFSPEGRLFVTDNGYDDRGSRPVWGAPDLLWAIEPGTWYGWPDFVGGVPVQTFKPPGKPAPEFVLAQHPQTPPQPRARLGVHSSANGFDFSREPTFGHVGQAFIALFGDQAPTVGKVWAPVGCRVVRVNVETGEIEDFAVNRGPKAGPASKIGGGGLERPIAARFSPRGDALYIVDFGVLLQHGKTSIPQARTGVLWRIVREGSP